MVMSEVSIVISLSISSTLRISLSSSAVRNICGINLKRRVSSMVLMKISRSAGDGPLTIIYSSVRQAQPMMMPEMMIKPAILSQTRWRFLRLSFFSRRASASAASSLVSSMSILLFISVSLILFFTVTPSQFYLINAHIHWRAWTQ